MLSWKSNADLEGLGCAAQLLRETYLHTARHRPANLVPQATAEPSDHAADEQRRSLRGSPRKPAGLRPPTMLLSPAPSRMAPRDCTRGGTKQDFMKLLYISQLMMSLLLCLGPSLQPIPGVQQGHDASTWLCLHSQLSAPSLPFPLPKKIKEKKMKS